MATGKSHLTQERLKSLLHYNPDSGVFTWKRTQSNRCIAGNRAGRITPGHYTDIGCCGRRYKAGHLAWLYVYGEWPDGRLHRLNGLKHDDSLGNLALASRVRSGELTQDRLKSLLHYDPQTGWFTNRVWRGTLAKQGERAGYTEPRGYVYIVVDGTRIGAHRLAWFYTHGRWPKDQIDHMNGNRSDNRLCNLREATAAENSWNTRGHCDSETGLKGVSRVENGKFRSDIQVHGTHHYLGRFATCEEAEAAYAAAASELFGAFKSD